MRGWLKPFAGQSSNSEYSAMPPEQEKIAVRGWFCCRIGVE